VERYEESVLKKLQEVELELLHDFIEICEKHSLQFFGFGGTAIGALRHQGFIPWDDDIDLALNRADYEKLCEIIDKEYNDKYYILRYETNKNYPLHTARMCKKGTIFHEHAMKNVDCSFGIFLDLYAFDNVPDDDAAMKRQAILVWIYSKLLILCSIEQPNLVGISGFKKNLVLFLCEIAYKFFKLIHLSTDSVYYKAKNLCTKYNNQETTRLAYLPEARPYASMIKRTDLYPLQKLKFEDVEIYFPKDINAILEPYYGDTYMTLPPEEKRYNHCPYRLEFGEEEA